MALTPSFEPVRAKWYGVRTATPAGLTSNEEGAWWYRSDLNCFCYWDGAIVHCWGGAWGIAFYGTAELVCPSAGNYVVNVGLSSPWAPGTINQVISIYNVTTSPVCDPGTPTGVVATAPVVGFTLIGVGAGTTLTAAVIARGW